MQRLLVAIVLAGLAGIAGAQSADAADVYALYHGPALALAGVAAVIFLAIRRRRP